MLVCAGAPQRCPAQLPSPADDPVIQAMDAELGRSMDKLSHAGKAPLYYLSYRLYEGSWDTITAWNGALLGGAHADAWRMLSVDLRVGDPRFDNTHFLRVANTSSPHVFEKSGENESILPAHGAGLPLRQCLWLKTDEAFKDAQSRYAELCASNDVLAQEEDRSNDFSLQPVHKFASPVKNIPVNNAEWEARILKLSKIFLRHPGIENSTVSFIAEPTTRYMVTSEGSQLIEQHPSYRVAATATALTNDGTSVWLYDSIESTDPQSLVKDDELSLRLENMAASLEKLRNAPPAEPYVGPAILSGKAASVFFHETFGHRIEAVHEKSEGEGKTFASRLGTAVMPQFISVTDDPTISTEHGEVLTGHYLYDDEGVPGRPVVLAKNGVLTGFLLSRTMVSGFKTSNGHGRAAPGWNPVARQSNLIVSADARNQLSPQALHNKLIEEAKKQHKPYGLYFDEIAGGSTFTTRGSEQTYKMEPLRVFKVFVDGRPDQLIRGADIVGTPLAALEHIIATGTDHGIFNGRCGRDSGEVPVSAVAPSLLLESIEIKRTAKTFQRSPILPDPTFETDSRGQPGDAVKEKP